MRAGVSDFILSGCHVGAVFGDEVMPSLVTTALYRCIAMHRDHTVAMSQTIHVQASAKHRFGVEVEAGGSSRCVIAYHLV